MAKQIAPPPDNLFKLLLEALLNIIQKLSDPIPLLVIAICIIILLAAAIGGERLVIALRIFFGFLAVVGVVAIIVSQLLSHSTNVLKRSGGPEMSADSLKKVQVLRKWLEVLNPVQFQGLIGALLTPAEQDELSQPVTKGSFLNDMHRWGKLNSVEQYLHQKFPDRYLE